MTTAQKEYLTKRLKIVGVIAYVIALLVFTILGAETHNWMMWVGCAMILLPSVPIAFYTLYMPIGATIWHWRLMGECHTEWEAKVLNQWWFFIYRSESWPNYISEWIWENYPGEEEREVRYKLFDFMYRLEKVKKPMLL